MTIERETSHADSGAHVESFIGEEEGGEGREKGRAERPCGGREREEVSEVLPFKGRSTMHVHRGHTAGQNTACLLSRSAGVTHSAGSPRDRLCVTECQYPL